MRRSHRSRQEWEALVLELGQSKVSVAEFARQHGVPVSSLHHWRSVLRRRAAPEEPSPEVSFVELVAAEPARQAPAVQAEAWLELGGTSVLHFRRLPEAGYLARLVRALVA